MRLWHLFWYKYHEWRLTLWDMPIRRHIYHVGKYVKHSEALNLEPECH